LVPLETKPGRYAARVIGSGPEPVSFLVEFDVGPTAD